MESAVATSTPKKGWWGNLSTTNKVLIGLGIGAVIGGIVYFGFIRKKGEEEEGAEKGGAGSTDEKKGTSETKSEETTETKTTDTGAGSGTGAGKGGVKSTTTQVKKEVKTTTPTSTNTTTTTTTSTTVHDVKTLPNGGKDCGQVHTNYDRDFDYVKCSGVWYTKSKPNPATPSKKGAIPNWKSLSANKIATERLNSRYPNG
jgi:hypothetical protein